MTNYSKARYSGMSWCRVARIARAEQVRYFGTLAPENVNGAQSVKELYR